MAILNPSNHVIDVLRERGATPRVSKVHRKIYITVTNVRSKGVAATPAVRTSRPRYANRVSRLARLQMNSRLRHPQQ